MCRLIGIVASEPTEFSVVLAEAPRSLSKLSREHPDGWGIAIWDGSFRVQRGIARAAECALFRAVSAESKGRVLVAHVRQKTVGPTRLENTHPFERDGWVFAHNGTVEDQATLRAGTSAARLAEITGDTDSELLFSYLLTRLDDAGLTKLDDTASREAATRLLSSVTADLRSRRIGAFNFLLTDGGSCFTHRFGRSMYVVERRPAPPESAVQLSSTVTPLPVASWKERRHAVVIASERITDENWCEVPDGTFFRVDRLPIPTVIHDTRIERGAA